MTSTVLVKPLKNQHQNTTNTTTTSINFSLLTLLFNIKEKSSILRERNFCIEKGSVDNENIEPGTLQVG